jgi:hypothetical protein
LRNAAGSKNLATAIVPFAIAGRGEARGVDYHQPRGMGHQSDNAAHGLAPPAGGSPMPDPKPELGRARIRQSRRFLAG